MIYNLENIEASSLSDAWFQTIYKCIEKGREFKIDRGSYEGQKRLEFDYITIQIKHSEVRPLVPKLPSQYNIPDPVEESYLYDYLPYLMEGELKEGESYTYGQRLSRFPISEDYIKLLNTKYKDILIQEKDAWENNEIILRNKDGFFLNQIELLIWTYKHKGFRNNQMVLQVAMPSDMLLQDPPCLRQIQVRIQDGKLHPIVYFRSWDLWNGFPANLGAIQLLSEYISEEISEDYNLESGSIIASSAGLHIYDYVFELAECIRGKTIEEFRKGK